MRKRSRPGLQYLLRAGVRFHGHLGPYLVLGLRMGTVAVRKLKPKRLHEVSAIVWTKTSPPQSCVLDGIQVSTGCTLGKGNIRAKDARHTKARFRTGGRTVAIEPTRKALSLLSRVSAGSPQTELQEIALELNRMTDAELFTIK
jgi:formylmethanofuran dehydrogenase subunit E